MPTRHHVEMKQVAIMVARVISLFVLVSLAAATAGQRSRPLPAQNGGYLDASRDHVQWPPPESLARDLHSKNDKVRLKALKLVGFTEQEARVPIWEGTKVVGEAVLTPDQIELEYAALGEDAAQQAILAVHASQKQITFAAVAVPKPEGWERIATFDCWCKYEMYLGQDALAISVQVRPAPDPGPTIPGHFELVLRATGGGTGIYTQNEGHFRVYQGELHRVLSFVSRRLSCPSPQPCNFEKRWFYTTDVGKVMGGVLVEGRGSYGSENQPPVVHFVRELENRSLQEVTCSTYRWDEQRFRYEPVVATNPCEPAKQ
jgi:hypothetical protein